MKLRLSLAVMACGLITAGSGCTTPNAAFRGQSPEMMTATPTGWNPHHYGTPEHFYSGTETFSGAMGPWSPVDGGGAYYGGGYPGGPGGGLSPRREQRYIARGILPPGGGPYGAGLDTTARVPANATPSREVNGVKMYDVGLYGWTAPQCPPGMTVDQCRGHGYDIMPGGCQVSGAEYIRWAPTHYSTYNYNRPNDLVYPSQNSVGGSVVYSYYTLKGPSDFFRDEDGVF